MEKRINLSPWPILVLSAFCLLTGYLIFAPLLFLWFALLLRAYDISKYLEIESWKFHAGIFTYLITSAGLIKIVLNDFSIITVVQSVLLSGAISLCYEAGSYFPSRHSKVHMIIFWFAVQYLCLILFPSHSLFFLADAPAISLAWIAWNVKTGFLGVSLWVFIINLLIYKSFPVKSHVNWIFLALALVSIMIPVLISLKMETLPLTAQDMLLLYQGQPSDGDYANFGEMIARTATWISVLIIIFTLVKFKTRKAG